MAASEGLLAGREAPPKDDHAVTLADVINSFLTYKEQLKDSGERAPRTFQRYEASGKMLAAFFGRDRRADDLTADDFLRLRADMSKRWGPVALGNKIQIIRSILRYGHDCGRLDKPIRFGPALSARSPYEKSSPQLFL